MPYVVYCSIRSRLPTNPLDVWLVDKRGRPPTRLCYFRSYILPSFTFFEDDTMFIS
jgi:hypothetical protein